MKERMIYVILATASVAIGAVLQQWYTFFSSGFFIGLAIANIIIQHKERENDKTINKRIDQLENKIAQFFMGGLRR